MIANANHISKAHTIKKSLGYKSAAGYLRNRNYTLEQALKILFQTS